MQFFELLQIAIGNRSQLSRTPTAEEWREICALAKKQAMVGIAFCGVEQLPVEQRPPRKLWMQWYTAAERIKGLNAEMDRKVFKVARMFRREGFQGVVLKGQGMAQLYKVERSTVNSQRTDHPDGIIDFSPCGRRPSVQHSTFNGNNLTQNSQNNCQGQGQQTTVNGQRTDHPDGIIQHSTFNGNDLTQNSQNTQNISVNANIDTNLDSNSQNAHTQACAGQDSQRLNDNVNDNQGTGKFSILNSQFSIKEYRTPGDIDIWLHGERDEILEYVRWHVPDCKPVYHHVDFPVVDDVSIEVHFTPTWMNSPIRNRRLQRFFKSMVNSQQSTDGPHPNPLQGERGLGLPDEGFDLTQNSQNTQKNIVSQDKQSTLDENSQNLHDASPVRLPDGSTVDRRPSTVDTCLDSKQATFPVPNNAFNRIYILVHIYRHLFAEGIGLRQLLDYYFVLQQGFTESEREETLRILRSLGMMRFTRAVMWVLQEVFGMPDRYLLTSPDAKEGRFLLDEIMLAGNFGKYDERMQRAAGEGTFRWGLRKVLRNFRFVRSYPSEVLWSPIFKVWHLFWRIRHA